MSRIKREEIVSDLTKRIDDAKGMIAFDYSGLSVELISGLRNQIRQAGSEILVAKNTLLKIAAKDKSAEQLQESFAGQTAVTFIDGDPALAAKVLTKFAKDNPDLAFKIRAGVLGQTFLSEDDIKQLGDLPAREVLLGQFVGVLAAPVTGLVAVLADIPRKFLRVLTVIADQKKDS